MKIASFNINGIRARLPRLLEWLEREQPDVACLQELKCADEALPVSDIEAAGYGAVWHGQKGFNGVAILRRGGSPDLRRVGLPGDPEDSHSRYIEAEIDGVVIASLYLPNGNPVGTDKFAYKLAWMERMRQHSAELFATERPVVLAGDWNVVPEDRDVFSAERMRHDALMQPETRAAWRRILHQGWTDALRALHPKEERLYTFWDYTAGCWQRDAGFRIDHLLLSPVATDRLQAAGVDRWARGEEKASDHAPTWIKLAA
ncbi:exodeoxyribonuclease III [Sphingomonas sp. GCM10030256]|uniref:exodeoxyribonuclease III n=1 Tax=Sphingomonas sp. GCM10030256 TaxID=3273427 RepID=UPI00361D7CCA